jgi:hypothetical protein
MGRLIQLIAFAALVWLIYSWWTGGPHLILPNSPQQTPSASPAPAAPSVAPPNGLTPAISNPTAINPKPPAPTPSDLAGQLEAAKVLVAQKAQALVQAKAPILSTLQSNPDYKQAVADAENLRQQVRVARDQGADNLSDLAAQWLAAKNKVTGMESAAFDKSPAVQQAANDFYKAQQDEGDLERTMAEGKKK